MAPRPGFSPVALYEQGRKETTENQPRYYEHFRKLLMTGLAFHVGEGETEKWFVLAPWSRLEPHVVFAYDLAVEGEAGLHRIEFEQINLRPLCDGTVGWGDFNVKGWPVASFRPLTDYEDPDFDAIWNARSGCAPVKSVP